MPNDPNKPKKITHFELLRWLYSHDTRPKWLVSVEAPEPDEDGNVEGDVYVVWAKNSSGAAMVVLEVMHLDEERFSWHVSDVAEA